MRRSSGLSVVVIGALLSLSACTASSHQSTTVPEVRIGLLGSFSNSPTGQAAARGAELAALVVNQPQSLPVPLAGSAGLPGLGGAKVRIIQADTHSSSDPNALTTAPDAATRLVTGQHVAGLVSVDTAQITAAASERTERIGVPFLSAVASADFLTERGLDWYFRVTPTDQMVAQSALALIDKKGGGGAVVGIVHASDEPSSDAANSVQGLAKQAGDAGQDDLGFTQGQSPKPVVDEIHASKPKPNAVIAVASQAGDAKALIQAGALSATQGQSLAIGAGFTPATVRQAGLAAGAQLLHATAWSSDFAERNLAASAVGSLYQRRFNTPMTEAAAETFTAVLTLAQAVDAARSLDAQPIRTALLGLNVPGRDTIMPWGGIRFDQTGQNVEASALVEAITPDVTRVVFPPELAGGNT